jgi:hypothetical protein
LKRPEEFLNLKRIKIFRPEKTRRKFSTKNWEKESF